MKKLLLLASISTLTALSIPAQTPDPSPDPKLMRHWRCETPGGTYIIRLGAITSFSTSEYIVDGVGKVFELTVGTNGSTTGRFYAIEVYQPNLPSATAQAVRDSLTARLQDAATQTGLSELDRQVLKNYPTTTHSHMVEYRLANRAEVQKLFDDLEEAVRTGRGRTIKVP